MKGIKMAEDGMLGMVVLANDMSVLEMDRAVLGREVFEAPDRNKMKKD
jgi:hypothetical protein